MAAAGREIGDVLCWPGCLQVAVLIRKANDGGFVADVDPLGIATGRIKGDAVGAAEPFGKDGGFPRFSIGSQTTEDSDFAAAAFSQEKVTVRSGADQAGIVESRCVKLNGEAVRRFRPGILGTSHELRTVVCRIGPVRSGKILRRNLAGLSGLLDAKIGVGWFGKRRVGFYGNKFRGRRDGLFSVRGGLERF